MSASEKILSLRAKIAALDPVRDMPTIKAYEDVIKSLQSVVESQPQIVVHKTVEPEVCESCQ